MVYKVEPLDLNALFMPVAAATAALVRLDERLAHSPVREGWTERQHFADAAATLWLEGELVHLEDLVLHDAHMNIRMPTHELTRAHAVLRVRRQILANRPDWALSIDGLRQLTGNGKANGANSGQGGIASAFPLTQDAVAEREDRHMEAQMKQRNITAPDELTLALQGVDAALERSEKVLDGQMAQTRPGRLSTSERPELVYDLDWDEDQRLAEWQEVMGKTRSLPAALRAAILIDAWGDIEVLQRAAWLGPLLVAALLRQDGLAVHHLPSCSLGAKQIPRERRRARDRTERLVALVEAIGEAAKLGLKEHDRLMLARAQMVRRVGEKRTSSRLPALIGFVLTRPLVSSGTVQQALKVSKQGALNLISELGLREITGRGRFRAWGVL